MENKVLILPKSYFEYLYDQETHQSTLQSHMFTNIHTTIYLIVRTPHVKLVDQITILTSHRITNLLQFWLSGNKSMYRTWISRYPPILPNINTNRKSNPNSKNHQFDWANIGNHEPITVVPAVKQKQKVTSDLHPFFPHSLIRDWSWKQGQPDRTNSGSKVPVSVPVIRFLLLPRFILKEKPLQLYKWVVIPFFC